MQQQPVFEFTLLARTIPSKEYICHTWQEVVNKFRNNSLLNMPGCGTRVLEEYKTCQRRSYNVHPCPFSIHELDVENNLGHLWMFFAHLLDNDYARSTYSINLLLAETLDTKYVTTDRKLFENSEFICKENLLKIKELNQIATDYCDPSLYHASFVNALFQLHLYMSSSFDLFNRSNTLCDKTLFSCTSFGFEPITILYYTTQISGFKALSLYSICDLQREIHTISRDYLNDDTSYTRKYIITTKHIHEDYLEAVGHQKEEILQRNKNLLKMLYSGVESKFYIQIKC